MIKRQDIEMQYLRLLSVTMVVTAAYITEAEGQSSRMQVFHDVREIILDQISQIGSAEEGVDWEKALEIVENQYQPSFLFQPEAGSQFYIELLPVTKRLIENEIGHKTEFDNDLVFQVLIGQFKTEGIVHYKSNCSVSYPTRAGPSV